MSNLNRRQFLVQTGAAFAAATFAGGARAEEVTMPFRMGAQSYSFRNFDFEGSIAQLKKLGLRNMEYCGVHFPPAPEHEGFAQVRQKVKDEGIDVVAYGVESFTDNEEASRVKFDFGKAIGLEVITANPAHNAFDSLDKLTEEYGIKIAIHNHGPLARYDKVEDTLKAIQNHSAMIGACVDTGHVIRSGEKPHEVIEALGKRVHSLHLKDWIHGGEEQILGEGDLDLVAVAKALLALDFKGPLNLEFELSPDNPVPGMQAGLKNWKKAVKEAMG